MKYNILTTIKYKVSITQVSTNVNQLVISIKTMITKPISK